MGLFSKKCSICGDSGNMLTSKKLTDGHLCGNCKKRLSPWFDDFKHASTDEIREQIAYRENNRKELDDFQVTKYWGVKKYRVANQFVYDKARKEFVIVEGPIDDESVNFRDKNPDIIHFDQVQDVWLEVDEYWTEGDGEYEARPLNQNLTQDKYKDVFWRYDFYLNFVTTHPYAKSIRYKMNFKPTIMKVPQRGIFFKRGLGIGGTYRGDEIELLAMQLESFENKEEKAEVFKRKMDILLLKNKDKGLVESVRDGLIRDASNRIYFKKLTNMGAHASRAARISKLVL